MAATGNVADALALEPPDFPATAYIDPASGEAQLEARDDLTTRHLRTLTTLSTELLLAQPPKLAEAMAAGAAGAGEGEAGGASTQAMMEHIGAAHREADQLVQLLTLLHAGKQVQAEPRGAMPSRPVPEPNSVALSFSLKRKQLEAASLALERGAKTLRASSARARRAHAEARALRPHWRLLSLESYAPPRTAGAAVAVAGRDDREYALGLALASSNAAAPDAAAAAALVTAAEAAVESALPTDELVLRSDERGSLRMSDAAATPLELLRVDAGLDDRLCASFPFQTSVEDDSNEDAVGSSAAAAAAATVRRTHHQLLTAQMSLEMRQMFAAIASEARSLTPGALLHAQTRSVLLDCPHVPALTVQIGLRSADGDSAASEAGATAAASAGSTEIGLSELEIALFGRWQRTAQMDATGGGAPALLPFALSACAVSGMQRRLRVGLDRLAASWSDPRLICHWDYSGGARPNGEGAGTDDACLSASVELHIACGGGVVAALGVMVTAQGVHAQHIGGLSCSGESSEIFPLDAVVGVRTAEDGCAALTELVHAALGRTLLRRLGQRAEAAGLCTQPSLQSTRLLIRPPSAGDGAAVQVAKRARSEEKAPWLQLTLAPAPAPVRAVLCSSARGATPQVVDLRELRGDGELPKLIGLMAREVLPAA